MPKGIAVGVEDGAATIEFVDHTLRGVTLAELFKHTPDPSVVVKTTRPLAYTVPVEVARAAGLLDEHRDEPADVVGEFVQPIGIETLDADQLAVVVDGAGVEHTGTLPTEGRSAEEPAPTETPAAEEPTQTPTYDDGLPDMDWSRPAINDFAAALTPPLDVTGEKSKELAIKAIEDHQAANKAAQQGAE